MNFTKAIDLHTHMSHGKPHEPQNTSLNRTDLTFILQQYQRLYIACGGFSTFESVTSTANIESENEYLHDISTQQKEVFQWVVLDPRSEHIYKQSDILLKQDRCLGIKIHPTNHGYDTLQYADELFSFAQNHKTFLLTHPDAPNQLERLVFFADKYPNMKLIIAHLGSVEHIAAVKSALNHNIFVDTSGIASSQNNILEYAVEQIGSDRIFFGTDTYSAAFQRGRIEFAGINEQDKRNILYGNALREFPQFHNLM